MNIKRLNVKIVLILIATIFISGCMSHSMMSHPQITSEEVFISEMIPHHQEAIDTSRLVLNSDNPEVSKLASQIISAQELEVEMMNTWINEWYPSSTYKSKYTNMMPDLTKLEGKERDKAYLKGMIEHHKGAIEMAKQAQTVTLRNEVLELTNNIITTQEAEVKQIEEILKNI
jgi:uncharacterized protein (DUF305 family)